MEEKKYYIANLGCSKNKVDGSSIENILIKNGYVSSQAELADIIVVNTCGFIQSAREQSINTFFELNNIKKNNSKIILAGCLAQMFYEDLSKELSEADVILGNFDINAFEEIIKGIEVDKYNRIYGVISADNSKTSVHKIPETIVTQTSDFDSSIYLKIAEGCNNRCSFCAIPLIRGAYKSFDEEKIIKSLERSLDKGAYEVNIIAQDLLSYGSDLGNRDGYINLLEKIVKLKYDFKLRMLYMHPDRFNSKIIDFINLHKDKIIPYFDLAFQHGSDKILKKMFRQHDSKYYLGIINEIRDKLPESIIRSTFMIGFPGESEKTLSELEDFIVKADLDYYGFFIYSKEEGTAAQSFAQTRLSKRFLNEKIEYFRTLCDGISGKRLVKFLNKNDFAILEDKIDDNTFLGRVSFQAPEVDGITTIETRLEHKVGDVVKVFLKENVNDYDFNAVEI